MEMNIKISNNKKNYMILQLSLNSIHIDHKNQKLSLNFPIKNKEKPVCN